jgi:hypothetical protein
MRVLYLEHESARASKVGNDYKSKHRDVSEEPLPKNLTDNGKYPPQNVNPETQEYVDTG